MVRTAVLVLACVMLAVASATHCSPGRKCYGENIGTGGETLKVGNLHPTDLPKCGNDAADPALANANKISDECRPCPCMCGGDVTELLPENFYPSVQSKPGVLVMFYSPTCKTCRDFEAQFANLAQVFQGKSLISFARMSVEDDEQRQLFGVDMTPTFKLYVAANPEPVCTYEGEVTREGLFRFLEEKSPNVERDAGELKFPLSPECVACSKKFPCVCPGDPIQLDNNEMASELAKKSVVNFFTDEHCYECKKFAGEWKQIAKRYRTNTDVVVSRIDVSEPADKQFYNVKEVPQLSFYGKGSTTPLCVYDGDLNGPSVIAWIDEWLAKEAAKLEQDAKKQ